MDIRIWFCMMFYMIIKNFNFILCLNFNWTSTGTGSTGTGNGAGNASAVSSGVNGLSATLMLRFFVFASTFCSVTFVFV